MVNPMESQERREMEKVKAKAKARAKVKVMASADSENLNHYSPMKFVVQRNTQQNITNGRMVTDGDTLGGINRIKRI